MSFLNKLKKYFSNHAETGDKHWDDSLRTHYYKTTKDKALSRLEEHFSKSPDFELNAISKDHGEISLNKKKGRKAFIVATVIMVRPFQTAIDLSVTTEGLLPFDLGYSTKLINEIYSQLDKEFTRVDAEKR